jgi:hypothetical protein
MAKPKRESWRDVAPEKDQINNLLNGGGGVVVALVVVGLIIVGAIMGIAR